MIDHFESRGYILILYAVQGDIPSNGIRVNVLKTYLSSMQWSWSIGVKAPVAGFGIWLPWGHVSFIEGISPTA